MLKSGFPTPTPTLGSKLIELYTLSLDFSGPRKLISRAEWLLPPHTPLLLLEQLP